MKTRERNEITLDQIISMVELIDDQLQDLRVKLRLETKPDMIPFRMSVVQHYRNLKIGIMDKVDHAKISRRELIGLIHQN